VRGEGEERGGSKEWEKEKGEGEEEERNRLSESQMVYADSA